MAARYAFRLDQTACSGCKACQAACKDRHALPVGVLWRRVYEVAGGSWRRDGEAWRTDAFAFNLSLACNHCAEPICAEVCPTGAIARRPDGLVLIDRERCLGCRYCSWACPYGAPQYDERTGKMTKCDLCSDDLAVGRPPACVAACPMRVLDLVQMEGDGPAPGAGTFPLPDPAHTAPGLVVVPHRDATRATARTAGVANREEVRR
jgi:anaerobic dimethyl sulfoxide reductase subunit B (iron-sulfur subunit)